MSSAIVFLTFLCAIIFGDGVVAMRRLTGYELLSEKACTAVARRDGEFVRQLLEQNIEHLCDTRCEKDDNTLLHEAAVAEAVTVAGLLLTPPINCGVDPLDSNGNTPLHDAAAVCQSPMTNLLLIFGADPNAANTSGFTPLCLAASLDSENCGGVALTLIKAGAKCDMKCAGKLPIDFSANKVTKDILMSMCPKSVTEHNWNG